MFLLKSKLAMLEYGGEERKWKHRKINVFITVQNFTGNAFGRKIPHFLATDMPFSIGNMAS